MVRPELRLRGRSASEEGEESLCDTVLCCIFLVMRCVRLRCVWFCVLLLDLGSQALVYACVSSCVPPHGGELQSISCCGPPVLEDDWCIVWVSTICLEEKWGPGSGLDLTIFSCVCYVLKVDYIVRWLPCDVLINVLKVDYIVRWLPCDVLIRLG